MARRRQHNESPSVISRYVTHRAAIVLRLGSESESRAWVQLATNFGIEAGLHLTHYDVVRRLADDLLNAYKVAISWTDPHPCCLRDLPADDVYCGRCGTRLATTRIDPVLLQRWIFTRFLATDDLSELLDDALCEWTMGDFTQLLLPDTHVFVVPAQGARLLAETVLGKVSIVKVVSLDQLRRGTESLPAGSS